MFYPRLLVSRGMGAVQRLEAALVRVEVAETAIEFYTEVMGLVELERDGDTTYLGCGLDANYDIAVRDGDPGVDRFAMRVTDEEFETHRERLAAHDVETRELTGPGHERGVYFDLPVCGATMGLVVVEDTRYHHSGETSAFLDSTAPTVPDRGGIAPTDIDHVALVSPDIEAEARFLEEVVDFSVSDAQIADGEWRNAFVRYGIHHHDVALFAGESENRLDHVAWAATDVSHMKLVADKLAQRDYQLSKPFTKHGPGGNVAFYFTEPGGTRFEYNAEMATVAPDAPEGVYEQSERKGGSSIWGGH